MSLQERPVEGQVDCYGARALCGWSPPSRAADTPWKRRVDVLRVGPVPLVVMLVAVIGLLNLAAYLPIRPALSVYALLGLAAGGWCCLNFWRCHHVHCLVSGPGWLAFALFAAVESALGRSLIGGDEEIVFLGILGIAVVFEAVWYVGHRTNAMG
ncbi:MAG: hypothetical protein ACREN4_02690 [Candidatus Dormibacteria bacterium]